jgi:hypothetical protein
MSDNTKQYPKSKQPQSAEQQPETPEEERDNSESKKTTDSTRFGDWEKNGRCIDF